MTNENDIWIVTDSNSGITEEEGKKLGIGIVPMPFTIDKKQYFENVNISRDEFFDMLSHGKKASTSQPSVSNLLSLFENGLKAHREIVYIPMSSALSGSCMTAKCLASSFMGRVQVVDNLRISCTQKQSVLEAVSLAEGGKNAQEIKTILESHKGDFRVYLSVENPDYLKEGGRIKDAELASYPLVDMRPVFQMESGNLIFYTKAKGIKNVQKRILEAVAYDMSHSFFGKDVIIKGAYTGSKEKGRQWLKTLSEYFPAHLISVDALPLSISCHTGPDSIAAACMEKIQEAPFVKYEI